MTVLEQIREPADLRQLTRPQLDRLAREIRDFLVAEVTRTGGHLGPNLGVVELTLALHRVFDSPRDRIVWDTGHQSYVHKMVTGRCLGFANLKQTGGLSGYPCRDESEHDLVENSHASTSLSWADGLAKAYELTGQDRAVVAVVGDGALTGGMCWEALNNIATAKDRPLVIVVNDNTRSYAPTTGGFADHLATLRTSKGYERFLEWGKQTVRSAPVVGDTVYGALHGAKKGLKDMIAPQGLFEDLGLKYVGPVDGHDVEAVETALVAARNFGGPVIVHCITEKGRGYADGGAARAGPVPPDRRRPVAGQAGRRPQLDLALQRGAGRGRRGAVRRGGDHRVDARADRAGGVRRGRTRTGSTTSASPSSTRSPRPPGWPWAGCTRWWRSTRPSSTGPSTRC